MNEYIWDVYKRQDKCEGYKFLDKENLELYQEVWIKVKS